jgi:AraC-like DNA-binding protein
MPTSSRPAPAAPARATSAVNDVVRASGYSHRGLVAIFRRAVGLTPKRYCRVLRFQRVLRRIAADREAAWADIALAAGYSDQPHFAREFREFTGVTPEAYRRAFSGATHHVKVNFVQDGARQRR